MKQALLIPVLAFICQAALAQNGNNLARTAKEQTVVHYSNDQTHAVINGVKTSADIMYFFKPHEIDLRRAHSEHVSMHVLVFGITVKDSNHPVQKYFEQKSRSITDTLNTMIYQS